MADQDIPPKRWARRKRGIPMPTTDPAQASKTRTPPKPVTDAEIEERFRTAALKFVLKCAPGFHEDSCRKPAPYLSEFLSWMRLGSHKEEAERILKIASQAKLPEGKCFLFRRGERTYRDIPELVLELAADAEWDQARAEASALLGTGEHSPMPSKAGDVWDWIRRQKEARFVPLNKIDPHLTSANLKDIVHWLRVHRDSRLEWETDHNDLFRLFLKDTPDEGIEAPINPVMPEMSEAPDFEKLQEGRRFFEELILAGGRDDDRPLRILRIDTRAEARRCFPFPIPKWPEYDFSRFLRHIPAIPGVDLCWDFSGKAGPWVISLYSAGKKWGDIRRAILEKRREVPFEQRYGLSSDAARLLRWLLATPPEEGLHGLSPVVEDRLKTGIGLDDSKWKENHGTMLGLLVREISAKTPHKVIAYPWNDYSQRKTRLFLEKEAGT